MVTRSHLMELPKKILIGEDVLQEIGSFIEVPRAARVTVASGTNVQEKVREVVASSLHGSVEWVGVDRSDMKNVRNVMKASSRAHCIIGLGGGKSVDVGKLAASKLGVPFYSVPTSASHDGIASPFASVNDSKRHYSIKAKPPVGILADVNVIAAAPARLFAAGCGDLVSKLTAVRDWQLGHDTKGEYYGGYAASLALMSARVVLDKQAKMGKRGVPAARDLVEALISAGVAAGIAGSSRPCSGSEHMFSHALDVIAPGKALHGEQCGVGTIMMAKLQGLEWREVRTALKRVGAPTKASELSLTDENVVDGLVGAEAIRPDRYTILSKVKLDQASARGLAEETGVI
ncbi:MAG: NAD(P)-dependent glycerol-1-phosphate dehydrogenase [Thaumarchaeota archaeon]|nr:NAD(P)-dependent glycerol-1-phosphate dehydrogenase [Nitrososphaerota archaeon]